MPTDGFGDHLGLDADDTTHIYGSSLHLPAELPILVVHSFLNTIFGMSQSHLQLKVTSQPSPPTLPSYLVVLQG